MENREIEKYLPDIGDMRFYFPHVSADDHREELKRIRKVVADQLKNNVQVEWHFSAMPYYIPRRAALSCPLRSNV